MVKQNFTLFADDIAYLKDQAEKTRKTGMSQYLRELIEEDRKRKAAEADKPS